MSTTLRLRDAASADAPAITSLLDELGYPASVAAVRERLAGLLEDPACELVVAEADGAVAGLAALTIMRAIEHDAPVAVLSALVVATRMRRHRLGLHLVSDVEERARRRGCRRIVLGTAERRAGAHAFYRSIGYVETGRRFARRLDA